MRELREELKNTKMIFEKDQLQLSSTIGQGSCIDVFCFDIDSKVIIMKFSVF